MKLNKRLNYATVNERGMIMCIFPKKIQALGFALSLEDHFRGEMKFHVVSYHRVRYSA